MALTHGTGPFGTEPHGRFNFDVPGEPEHKLWFEPYLRRIRVEVATATVAETTAPMLLHETGHLPVVYLPVEAFDERCLEDSATSTHCPFKGDASYRTVVVGDERREDALWHYPDPDFGRLDLSGHLGLYFHRLDAVFEEARLMKVHPRDPYHRVDALPSDRRVEVRIGDRVVADSPRPVVVFETSLPPRYYLPPQDVRRHLLRPSDTRTSCPYKGDAGYLHFRPDDRADGSTPPADDVAWTYDQPYADLSAVAGHIAFDPGHDRVTVTVDGTTVARAHR